MIPRNIREFIPDHTTSLPRIQQSLCVLKSTQYGMYCRLGYLFVYGLINDAVNDFYILKSNVNVIKK